MKKMNKLVAFMAMAMLSVSALAEKEPRQGFYIAPEVVNVTMKDYCKNLGKPPTCSESEIGFGLLGGYQFNERLLHKPQNTRPTHKQRDFL